MLSGIFKKKTKTKKILLADDEPDIAIIVSKILKCNGYDVIIATDGIQCLEMAENEKPHLILLDKKMPNMDGQTALTRLQASSKTKKIPVIMLTSCTDGEDIDLAQKSGATDYIAKPFDHLVLLEKIARILKNKVS
jgi:DNA-binding response OmpR family regulator